MQKLPAGTLLAEVADGAELRRPRRPARRHRREPRVGQVGRRPRRPAAARRRPRAARSSCPPPPARPRPPHRAAHRRRARRGPRRRDGAAVPVLHAGARRRDHGLRHPGPRRVGAPDRLRQRRVAGRPARPTGSSRSSGTTSAGGMFVAVHRGEGPRPGPPAAATCRRRWPTTTSTSSPATTQHRRRPRLEDALRLRARRPVATSTRCSSTIKRIDSVYDAYRIVPGKGG